MLYLRTIYVYNVVGQRDANGRVRVCQYVLKKGNYIFIYTYMCRPVETLNNKDNTTCKQPSAHCRPSVAATIESARFL